MAHRPTRLAGAYQAFCVSGMGRTVTGPSRRRWRFRGRSGRWHRRRASRSPAAWRGCRRRVIGLWSAPGLAIATNARCPSRSRRSARGVGQALSDRCWPITGRSGAAVEGRPSPPGRLSRPTSTYRFGRIADSQAPNASGSSQPEAALDCRARLSERMELPGSLRNARHAVTHAVRLR